MRHGITCGILFFSAVFASTCAAQSSDETFLRALVKTFADARNAHDGQAAAAIYSEDGEWMSANGQGIVRGRADLAKLWGGVEGQVERTIQTIEFVGPNIAVVRVATRYDDPIGRHNESFVFVKESGEWRIRVHQSVD